MDKLAKPVNNPAGAESGLNGGLAAMLKKMERDEFEKWCRENNGVPVMLKGADQYIVPVVQGAWMAWKARGALRSQCRGVAHHGCDYLSPCGSVCNKCGQAT
jgi:hypothetical protein